MTLRQHVDHCLALIQSDPESADLPVVITSIDDEVYEVRDAHVESAGVSYYTALGQYASKAPKVVHITV